MKETNMEHFRSEIEEILNQSPSVCLALKNGVPMRCGDMCSCGDCDFRNCTEWQKIKWLMSEYKPEPVLTAREKGFVECVEYGWITRDDNKCLMWHEEKPWVDGGRWDSDESHMYVNKECFLFITWEDEEPWSVEQLRKLKVEDEHI